MKDLGVVDKVRKGFERSEFDGVVIVGHDNLQYILRASLPFLHGNPDLLLTVLWPKGRQPLAICPVEWAETVGSLSWVENVEAYSEPNSSVRAAVGIIAKQIHQVLKPGARVGVDIGRASNEFFEELEAHLPEMQLLACDDWLNDLRMTKTDQERDLLIEVALRTDHAILGAVHHLAIRNPHSEKRLAEEIRVHCLERSLNPAGGHGVSLIASGDHARKFWPMAPKYGLGSDKMPENGELVRMEMRASLDGYWSDAARMLSMGEPTPEQWAAYQALVSLREAAVRQLRPGVKCSEVFVAVKREAKRLGVELIDELGIGHGIGVGAYERPYLSESDDTQLSAGMMLVLDPILYGPEAEILRSKDTVLITETGCEIVGWYKDWREPYIPPYTF